MRLRDLLVRFTGAGPELDRLRAENKRLRQAMERARIRVPEASAAGEQGGAVEPVQLRPGRNHSWAAWRREMEMRSLERSGEKKIAGFRES